MLTVVHALTCLILLSAWCIQASSLKSDGHSRFQLGAEGDKQGLVFFIEEEAELVTEIRGLFGNLSDPVNLEETLLSKESSTGFNEFVVDGSRNLGILAMGRQVIVMNVDNPLQYKAYPFEGEYLLYDEDAGTLYWTALTPNRLVSAPISNLSNITTVGALTPNTYYVQAIDFGAKKAYMITAGALCWAPLSNLSQITMILNRTANGLNVDLQSHQFYFTTYNQTSNMTTLYMYDGTSTKIVTDSLPAFLRVGRNCINGTLFATLGAKMFQINASSGAISIIPLSLPHIGYQISFIWATLNQNGNIEVYFSYADPCIALLVVNLNGDHKWVYTAVQIKAIASYGDRLYWGSVCGTVESIFLNGTGRNIEFVDLPIPILGLQFDSSGDVYVNGGGTLQHLTSNSTSVIQSSCVGAFAVDRANSQGILLHNTCHNTISSCMDLDCRVLNNIQLQPNITVTQIFFDDVDPAAYYTTSSGKLYGIHPQKSDNTQLLQTFTAPVIPQAVVVSSDGTMVIASATPGALTMFQCALNVSSTTVCVPALVASGLLESQLPPALAYDQTTNTTFVSYGVLGLLYWLVNGSITHVPLPQELNPLAASVDTKNKMLLLLDGSHQITMWDLTTQQWSSLSLTNSYDDIWVDENTMDVYLLATNLATILKCPGGLQYCNQTSAVTYYLPFGNVLLGFCIDVQAQRAYFHARNTNNETLLGYVPLNHTSANSTIISTFHTESLSNHLYCYGGKLFIAEQMGSCVLMVDPWQPTPIISKIANGVNTSLAQFGAFGGQIFWSNDVTQKIQTSRVSWNQPNWDIVDLTHNYQQSALQGLALFGTVSDQSSSSGSKIPRDLIIFLAGALIAVAIGVGVGVVMMVKREKKPLESHALLADTDDDLHSQSESIDQGAKDQGAKV